MLVDTKKCLPTFFVQEEKEMGRPKGGKNRSHSKAEKLALVKRNLAGETLLSLERESGIHNAQIYKWTRQYLSGGEAALENKKKPGNPLSKYQNRKELTPMEQLEYENALLRRELLAKNAELIRLKKAQEQEGGDA